MSNINYYLLSNLNEDQFKTYLCWRHKVYLSILNFWLIQGEQVKTCIVMILLFIYLFNNVDKVFNSYILIVF